MNPQQPYDPNKPPSVYPPPPTPYYGGPGYSGPGYLPSANGGTILTLGILSFFCFGFILGPIAWIMGNSALAAIDSGRANPSERSNVSAGRICGIISTALHALVIVIYGLIFLLGMLGAVASSASGSHP